MTRIYPRSHNPSLLALKWLRERCPSICNVVVLHSFPTLALYVLLPGALLILVRTVVVAVYSSHARHMTRTDPYAVPW